jgi:hypothetical protein
LPVAGSIRTLMTVPPSALRLATNSASEDSATILGGPGL